jgi:hypothetical protein
MGNSFKKSLSKLEIEHRVAMAYHPQIIKRKLQIGNSRVFLTRPLRREVKIGRKSWTEHYGHIRRHTRLRTTCGSRTGGWSLPCVMSD